MSDDKFKWDPLKIESLRDFFNRLDSNHDDHITVEELVASEANPEGTIAFEFWTNESTDHLLAYLSNHGEFPLKKIDFNEFLVALRGGGDGVYSDLEVSVNDIHHWDHAELQRWRATFQAIDVDGDGEITVDELLALRKKQAKATGDAFDEKAARTEVLQYISRADNDGNQSIDFAEFLAAAAQDSSHPPPPAYVLPPDETDTAEWQLAKGELMDPDNDESMRRVEVLFDAVDGDGGSLVSLEGVLRVIESILNDRGDETKTPYRRESLIEFHHAQRMNDGSVMDIDEFVLVLQNHLMVTNEELQYVTDVLIWNQCKEKAHLVFNSSTFDDIKDLMPNLRHQVVNSLETKMENPGMHLARTKRVLQVAMSVSEHLFSWYERYMILRDEHKEAVRNVRSAQRQAREANKQKKFQVDDLKRQYTDKEETWLLRLGDMETDNETLTTDKTRLQEQMGAAAMAFQAHREQDKEDHDRHVQQLHAEAEEQGNIAKKVLADLQTAKNLSEQAAVDKQAEMQAQIDRLTQELNQVTSDRDMTKTEKELLLEEKARVQKFLDERVCKTEECTIQ